MALALFQLLPQLRGPVLLTTPIIENLTSRLQSLKEFQTELRIEFSDREIFVLYQTPNTPSTKKAGTFHRVVKNFYFILNRLA